MLLLVGLGLVSFFPAPAFAIPQWAREYGVTCAKCHVSVPRLNRFGAEFMDRGYQMPADSAVRRLRTIPLAFWLSGRSDTRPVGAKTGEHVRAYLNRLEAISGGRMVVPWLSYFVEWRLVSLEPQGDGNLRDRSGRFEDLFLTASGRNLEVTAGQFRQMAQVDVSRRLGINEPLVLGSSLPGSGGGTGRERSLRGFAPGARSPSVRVAWNGHVGGNWRWTTSAALPIPGEFSIPLNSEARREASNEVEWRRKGVFAESFVRSGPTTLGAHVFYDDRDRFLTQAVTTGRVSSFYWTGIGGAAKTGGVLTGRWSMEGEYIPHQFVGIGGRLEDRAGDKAQRAFLPYVNLSLPATQYTFRVTLERRLQQGRNGTFLEFGTVF